MFGFFGKKPPADLENALGQQGYKVAQNFFYVVQKGQIPPHQAHERNPITLSSDVDRSALVEKFIEVLNHNKLHHLDTDEKLEAINAIALDTLGGGKIPERIMDGALFLTTTLSFVDMIARVYYRDYPEHKPLFEMVNQLAKVIPPALDRIFDNDIPKELRETFPHVSSLIEQNRANG